MTKLIEERLGIDIEFVYLPASTEDAITKISLWATDPNAELPDVIVGGELFDNNAKELGEAGLLLDWAPYRNDAKLMPTYSALPDVIVGGELFDNNGFSAGNQLSKWAGSTCLTYIRIRLGSEQRKDRCTGSR